VAEPRETLLRQIYKDNKATMDGGWADGYRAAIIPANGQQDPREAAHVVEKLQMAGVSVGRANKPFELDGKQYAAGSFVVPFSQVFGRYAKDMLEKQTYPEVRRSPTSPPEPPYDVTAWSLGMLLGVNVDFTTSESPRNVDVTLLKYAPPLTGDVKGSGSRFEFDYKGPDTAAAMNALLKAGAKVAFDSPSHVVATGAARKQIESIASQYGLSVTATDGASRGSTPIPVRAPRIGMYQPWTGGNMDEGWTRWVLEQYGFQSTPLHNADIRAGHLRDTFDAIILPDQNPRTIVDGANGAGIRPEYRGGIGDAGVDALQDFVAHGGTLITLGAACDLAIDRLGVPVKDLKEGLSRDEHFAPGTILNVDVDTTNPIGYGVAPETRGFYNNSPFFDVMNGFSSQKVSVIARYPNDNVVASGWLKGEALMQGRAAVVSVDMNSGRIVLFGLRPQHRAQTHATFPLLFNALYLAAR
jgi:hypothetical protein